MNNHQKASVLRLLTLNIVLQTSDSEEFEIAAHLANQLFNLSVEQIVDYYDESGGQTITLPHEFEQSQDGPTEEKVQADGVQPLAITEPGWYRTASGDRAEVIRKEATGKFWIGTVHHADMYEYYNEWLEDGNDCDFYEKWMIVAKISD